jgi:hypothetical protein
MEHMGSPEKALNWLRDMIPRLEVVVAERAVCESPLIRDHLSATELLATVMAALPEIEARAANESEAAKRAAEDDGNW